MAQARLTFSEQYTVETLVLNGKLAYFIKCRCGDCFLVQTVDEGLDAKAHECWPSLGVG